jgi:hypothetical protein
MFGDWPWDGTATLFVATEIGRNIRRLRGVEGIPFQWVRPLSLHKNTTINLVLAWLGLNHLEGTEKRLCFVACIFLELWLVGGF